MNFKLHSIFVGQILYCFKNIIKISLNCFLTPLCVIISNHFYQSTLFCIYPQLLFLSVFVNISKTSLQCFKSLLHRHWIVYRYTIPNITELSRKSYFKDISISYSLVFELALKSLKHLIQLPLDCYERLLWWHMMSYFSCLWNGTELSYLCLCMVSIWLRVCVCVYTYTANSLFHHETIK